MSTTQEYCPLCGSAHLTQRQDTREIAWTFSCKRCGCYRMNLRFLAGINTLKSEPDSARLLPYLSAHLRQASDRGEILELLHDNWEAFADAHAHTPVSRKLDVLLQLFAARSTAGKTVSLDPDDFVLLDAADAGEMNYLVTTLVEQDKLRNQGASGWYIVTAKGWECVDPLDPGGVPGTCFVAMAFDSSLDEVYEKGIKPAITAAGLTVIRADDPQHNDVITDVIQAEIRRAQVIVADVTLQNPGVYFEAGLALGLGRIVIWSCHEDELKKVHFDTRQYSHVVWKNADDLRSLLEARIRATVSIPVKH